MTDSVVTGQTVTGHIVVTGQTVTGHTAGTGQTKQAIVC